MMPGTSPITSKGVFGPEPASVSRNQAGAGPAAREAKEELAPSALDLMAMAEEFNHKISMIHDVDLQFSVHEGSGQILVKVTDPGTGELIREIPPSEMLDLAARIDDMIGLIFDLVG
jgi:uncharacterized FlaG/YvyC family protein